MTLEEVLSNPWICKRSQEMQEMRKKSDELSRFQAYSSHMASYGIEKRKE